MPRRLLDPLPPGSTRPRSARGGRYPHPVRIKKAECAQRAHPRDRNSSLRSCRVRAGPAPSDVGALQHGRRRDTHAIAGEFAIEHVFAGGPTDAARQLAGAADIAQQRYVPGGACSSSGATDLPHKPTRHRLNRVTTPASMTVGSATCCPGGLRREALRNRFAMAPCCRCHSTPYAWPSKRFEPDRLAAPAAGPLVDGPWGAPGCPGPAGQVRELGGLPHAILLPAGAPRVAEVLAQKPFR